jgi:hypothetical protein
VLASSGQYQKIFCINAINMFSDNYTDANVSSLQSLSEMSSLKFCRFKNRKGTIKKKTKEETVITCFMIDVRWLWYWRVTRRCCMSLNRPLCRKIYSNDHTYLHVNISKRKCKIHSLFFRRKIQIIVKMLPIFYLVWTINKPPRKYFI